MTLFELQPNEQFISNPTLKEATQKLNRLIIDLQKRSLPADLIQTINSKIEGINTSNLVDILKRKAESLVGAPERLPTRPHGTKQKGQFRGTGLSA